MLSPQAQSIVTYLRENPGKTDNQIAEALGMPVASARRSRRQAETLGRVIVANDYGTPLTWQASA